MTTVYTDGACLGNPGPGGWAWAVPDGPFAAGADPATTNQRMEVKAALEAVTTLEGPLLVVSDSTYVVKCFNDGWWKGWLERGWLNKARQPVANRDLWEPLIAAVRSEPERVTFRWVKGHSADVMNDLVDRLAVEAARGQVSRAGTGVPEALGPPDAPGAGTGPVTNWSVDRAGKRAGLPTSSGDAPGPATEDARLPAGRRLVVTGLRPPGLGGYDDNPVAEATRRRLADILGATGQLHPDLVVLTGLGLGAEQLGAEAALKAAVPYVAVLAFPGQEKVWPPASQKRFGDLLAGAAGQVVLSPKAPASKQLAAAALARRDAWLARHAHQAVVVWDGDDAGVGRQVRSLQDHLGEDEVWTLEPGL